MISTRIDWREGRAVLLAAACAFVGLCSGAALAVLSLLLARIVGLGLRKAHAK